MTYYYLKFEGPAISQQYKDLRWKLIQLSDLKVITKKTSKDEIPFMPVSIQFLTSGIQNNVNQCGNAAIEKFFTFQFESSSYNSNELKLRLVDDQGQWVDG